MDQDIVVPVAALIAATVITLSCVSIVQYTKYKLKAAQIQADAQIKIEEIKAKSKNQADGEIQ